MRQQLQSIALGLLVLFAIGVGVFWFAAAMIRLLGSVQSDFLKTLVASAGAVVAAAITIVGGKIWELKIKIRQDIREKKVPVYEGLVKMFFRMFYAESLGEQRPSEQELRKTFAEFTEQLVMWGSSEVIRTWGQFRTQRFDIADFKKSTDQMEGIFRAIRKDLGNDIKKLRSGDLLRLWVNDPRLGTGLPPNQQGVNTK
jgi:hypothetical protein